MCHSHRLLRSSHFSFFTATVEDLELPEIQCVSIDKVFEGRREGCGQTRRNKGRGESVAEPEGGGGEGGSQGVMVLTRQVCRNVARTVHDFKTPSTTPEEYLFQRKSSCLNCYLNPQHSAL